MSRVVFVPGLSHRLMRAMPRSDLESALLPTLRGDEIRTLFHYLEKLNLNEVRGRIPTMNVHTPVPLERIALAFGARSRDQMKRAIAEITLSMSCGITADVDQEH